ncbi:AAA domain-containing protein [Immersiella caudata]|uniref:AAA domain-containing protein n=1 Tax=Immersiella caudata TaxID=314043 RepID=A0AA39WYQ9_9PEZI|nr:AAA domain-containing protein [Immersiella caudata]
MDASGKNALNKFVQLAKISVLEMLVRTSWPCLMLTTQHRMASGSFDLAKKVIYKNILDADFSYGPDAQLSKSLPARMIEQWVVKRFKAKESPAGKASQSFFTVREPCTTEPTTKSRYNTDHVAATVKLSNAIFNEFPGLCGSKVVIITPYRMNLQFLEDASKAQDLHPKCQEVEINTPFSFHGCEGVTVDFCMTLNQETGSLFVQDPHRVCIGLTRHECALFMVGDIHTTNTIQSARKRMYGDGNSGEALSMGSGRRPALKEAVEYLWVAQRVVAFSPRGEVISLPNLEVAPALGA